jgi:GTP-binding protein LepA
VRYTNGLERKPPPLFFFPPSFFFFFFSFFLSFSFVPTTGQVGYVIPNMKTSKEAYIGDTFFLTNTKTSNALPGFKAPKPMVFASLYPIETGDFEKLVTAVEKLTLNDSSVTVKRENSTALGSGFRCGFLGVLHADIFQQRLKQEYDVDVITTAPQVPFNVFTIKGETIVVESAAQFPENQEIRKVEEPIVMATIIAPTDCLGPLMTICQDRRGEQKEMRQVYKIQSFSK